MGCSATIHLVGRLVGGLGFLLKKPNWRNVEKKEITDTFGKGEYQGTQSPSAATPGAAASPSILRHIHVLRTLRLSKSAENFEEHEV